MAVRWEKLIHPTSRINGHKRNGRARALATAVISSRNATPNKTLNDAAQYRPAKMPAT